MVTLTSHDGVVEYVPIPSDHVPLAGQLAVELSREVGCVVVEETIDTGGRLTDRLDIASVPRPDGRGLFDRRIELTTQMTQAVDLAAQLDAQPLVDEPFMHTTAEGLLEVGRKHWFVDDPARRVLSTREDVRHFDPEDHDAVAQSAEHLAEITAKCEQLNAEREEERNERHGAEIDRGLQLELQAERRERALQLEQAIREAAARFGSRPA